MSTIVNFKGRKIIEPGVYAQVKSGIPAKPSAFSTGNLCIIDTGSGVGFGGGSGISGTDKNGLKAVYGFEDITDFQAFVRGGLLYDVADLVFNPEVGENGPEKVFLVRAAETTPAEITYEFVGAGTDGGRVKFLTLNEGDCSNGKVAEDLAKSIIKVVGPIAINDTADIQILGGGGSITGGNVTATTTSTADFATKILNAINSNNSGYTAVLQGGNVVVSAPVGTGNAGNLIVLTTFQLPVVATTNNPTMTGGVDEVLATVDFQITNAGSAGDVLGIENTTTSDFFGYYTVQTGDVINDVAAGYAALINSGTDTHGHTAISVTDTITISAPVGSGTAANAYSAQVTATTGTLAVTPVVPTLFAGGVDEVLADVDITITNVGGAGSYIRVYVGGVLIGTYQSTGAGTVTAFAAALVIAINDGTATHGFTATSALGVVTAVAPVGSGNSLNATAVSLSLPFGVIPFLEISAFTGGSDSQMVTIGYGALLMSGTINASKFMIEFYEGTYRGKTLAGNDIDGLTPAFSEPILVSTSPEFDNIQTLIDWAKTDFVFSKRFKLDSDYNVNGTGAVTAADLVTYQDVNLAIDGTTTYNAAALDRVLEEISELDNTFFLSDRFGDDAQSAQNSKILDHIKAKAEMDKFLIVAGGTDETKFDEGVTNSSIDTAKFFDDESVIVVHSGNSRTLSGGIVEKLPAFHHAANVSGRLGGLEPQTPITFKAIKTKNFNHDLKQRQRETALQAGVLHNRFVPGVGNVVNQGINSIQRNTQLINPDGTSFEISIMRIAAQLNKELILNMRPIFVGTNVGSASPAEVKAFVESFLIRKTATQNQDNLIIRFESVSVRLVEDYYDIKYSFVPNGPINKLFATGFMLDNNLSA